MIESLSFLGIGLALAVLFILIRRNFADFPGQKPIDYEDGFPAFDLKLHLQGKMTCEGVIFGPMGRMTSSFVADFDCVWTGDICVMNEDFLYNDGARQTRVWTLTLDAEGGFTATAPDVPGVGKGVQAGPAVQLLYRIRLPEDIGGHVLDAADWMYLTPTGTIVNRSQFRKFGFKVAELVATIRPKESA